MTKEEMLATLKARGLKKRFKPQWEHESETILLETKRPATIQDGKVNGSEISVYDASCFCVWTSKKKKANAAAKAFRLKVKLLDGEAELYVPNELADQLLPRFGAKTKRVLSPERLEALKRLGNNLQKALICAGSQVKEGVLEVEGARVEGFQGET